MQGSAIDMVEDVGNGIAWVLENIGQYGGDREQVYVVGQSCGGHLAMLALLEQSEVWAAMAQNSTMPEHLFERNSEHGEHVQLDGTSGSLPFVPAEKWSPGDIQVSLKTWFCNLAVVLLHNLFNCLSSLECYGISHSISGVADCAGIKVQIG
jgi:hypothetical protein